MTIDPNAAPTAMQPEDGLIDEVDRGIIKRGERIGATLARKLLRHYDEAAAIITSLRAENERLRAGLKPFGQMAEADDYAGTPEGASVIVNVDRLRAARQIIDQEAGK